MAYTGPTAGSQSQQMLGRYRIIREIARSNDIVWEGIDPQVNRRVAVKELALDATLTGTARRQRIERFYREARAAGAMNHPNIVTIYEVGEDKGRYFIAMEYLDGQTLRERLSLGGALPLNEAVNVMAALCDALHYAHQQGVIHRDLKPDNIFLVRPDNRVKVADFGIARITHETQLTAAGQIFGTPSYMSPEQVLGRDIDARSDIFSLGIVLYEMVTGRKPFMGDSVVTITYRIMHEPTPAVLGASPALDSVIQKATAKNPVERYASAADFRAALLTAAEQYRHTGSSTLNGMPLGPLPAGAGPMPQATALYGTSTHQNYGGAASAPINGPIYDVAQLVGPGPATNSHLPPMLPPMQQPAEQRNYTTVLISLAMVGLFIVGGGWALTTALSRATGQSRAPMSSSDYDKAANLYGAKRYEEAAPLFKSVRQSPNSSKEMAAKAKQGESWCYRALGQRAMDSRDYKKAVEWYTYALGLVPDDAESLKGLQLAQQYGAVAATGSANPADLPRSTAPTQEPIVVANNNPENKPGANPYAGSTTNDFVRQREQNYNLAKDLLTKGINAQTQGNIQEACMYWKQAKEIPAVQDGSGTSPSLEADKLWLRYCGNMPLFGNNSNR